MSIGRTKYPACIAKIISDEAIFSRPEESNCLIPDPLGAPSFLLPLKKIKSSDQSPTFEATDPFFRRSSIARLPAASARFRSGPAAEDRRSTAAGPGRFDGPQGISLG